MSSNLKRAILGLVVASAVMGMAGTAFTPWLLVNAPLLLVALSPGAHNVVLTTPLVDPFALLTVCLVRRMWALCANYGLGGLYGGRLLREIERRSPRFRKLILWLEATFRRYGVVVLLVFPQYTLALLAGSTGCKFRHFLPALFVGQLLQVSVTVMLGRTLVKWVKPVLAFVEAHVASATLVTIAGVLVVIVVRHLLKRR